MRNALGEWRWRRVGAETTSIVDRRTGQRWAGRGADFTLVTLLGALPSDAMDVVGVRRRAVPGGTQLRVQLSAPGVEVTRTITAYDGVAGFAVATLVRPRVPLAIAGARLAQLRVPRAVTPTRHAFRAGADWREPGWPGPQLAVGDVHPGTWRDSSPVPDGPGQWLTLAGQKGRSAFLVTEANDMPSVRTEFAGGVAASVIDYKRDVVSLGPFEEQAHIENPGLPVGRVRIVAVGEALRLPSVFIGFGTHNGDEPWQFHKYLTRHRLAPYEREVTFNSNGTNTPGVSLGAKDGMNQATIEQVAPLARRLGVDTFILDDGWQAQSGDWVPDPARFPDDPDLRRVRATIAPMKLGLWMTPLHFHPHSQAYRDHPGWVCAPVGHALAAYNLADPESGSNAAGIAQWSSAALSHVERRIRHAITRWDVQYFKFDFLAWLDCAGAGDLWSQHDAFVAMVDRLQRRFPHVTFQIDETNDYRMFPFESVARGPSWFQNGAPAPERLLHNLWNLSPFVPATSLGQHFLGDQSHKTWPVGTLMAGALLSHMTFFTDLRSLPAPVMDAARPWIDFYHRYNRVLTGGVVYPLLDDPISGGWTALQSWDPEIGTGALLVFRQGGAAATKTVPLKNVPAGRRFLLREAPSGAEVGTVTSEDLATGIDIGLPPRGARVLLIEPVA